ncbi:tripartite motif-containing protein 2-like [Dreissena polymorpha]|uniref:Uncharacterized protein n=1 Tax=Dreissena polymorpha TaxID=45954 RepID=A0A9D4KZE5_DREPO|nr:tripartite motif-containing protein 2-like [Dreissena polymorpha]KAH3848751.1 hypothetical protein DPMN_091131 [Dreissena polymorpha]
MATGSRSQRESVLGASLILKNLECSICMETFTNPKDLECGHTFCEECIQEIITRAHNENRLKHIQCPVCRNRVRPSDNRIPPTEWARDMKTNYALLQLLDIIRVKDDDVPLSVTLPERTVASVENNDETLEDDVRKNLRDLVRCRAHGNAELQFYCKTHSALMCFTCRSRHSKVCPVIPIAKLVQKENIDAMRLSHVNKMAEIATMLESATYEMEKNLDETRAEFSEFKPKLDDLKKRFHKLISDLAIKINPQEFMAITQRQQHKVDELKSLQQILKIKITELMTIEDMRNSAHQFISLTIFIQEIVYLERAVSSAIEGVRVLEMRHVGIDAMTTLAKLGTDILGEIHLKTEHLRRRNSV